MCADLHVSTGGYTGSEVRSPSCCRAESHAERKHLCSTLKAFRLGNTRMCQPSTKWDRTCRANSLKIRFARLRSTALPSRRPTTIPICVWVEGSGYETRLKSGVSNRRPVRFTRSMSECLRRKKRRSGDGRAMRLIPSTSRVLSPDGGPTLCARSWYSCAF